MQPPPSSRYRTQSTPLGRRVRVALVAGVALALVPALRPVHAQSESAPAVGTRLGAASTKPGVIMIRGSTEVGIVEGRIAGETSDTGSVIVDAVVLTELGTGAQTTGLSVTLDDGRDHARSVWVDTAEIGGLTHALEYLATVDSSATPLGGFEATYRTRGALRIATYTDADRVWTSLTAEGPPDVTVQLPRERLATLRSLIQRARLSFPRPRPVRPR